MISRRNLLQLAGLSGLAAALPAGLRRADADSHGSGEVRRLIIISHCHGWPYASWKMRRPGLSEAQPWSLDLARLQRDDFSAPLRPLYDYRSRVLALDGLSLLSAELDSDGNRHDKGWIHAWTGNNIDLAGSGTRSTSLSLDQLIASHVARPDRLPSLELSLDDAREAGRPISYNPSGTRLPAENSPLGAWRRVFGASAAVDALGSRRRASIDFAYDEYKKLAPGLDAKQRQRLDAHYELVRGLGERLQGLADLQCHSAAAQPAPSFERYHQRFDAFVDVVTAALACDVTRVVTLSLGEMPTADFGADGITDDVHKGLAHGIYEDPAKHKAMTDYLVLHGEQVAHLVGRLESMPDPADGNGTLMDSTMIVWGSELADGWHGYQNYCPLIIGGSWAFNSGRYIYWPRATPAEMLTPAELDPSGRSQTCGLPHQKLLVSVARAMGADVDHVGLRHVRGQRGDFIDVSGPLDGLTG